MSTDLIERIGVLAREWETAAPTVTVDEVVGRTTPTHIDPETAPYVEIIALPTHRPRSTLWIAISTAAAVLIAVMIVTGRGRDTDDVDVEPVATEESVVEPTIAPSVAPVPTAAPTTIDEAAARAEAEARQAEARRAQLSAKLSAIESSISNSLAQLQSVRGIATVRRMQAPDPNNGGTASDATTVHDITLLDNGSLWVEGRDGAALTWASYDAATGYSRNSSTSPDGVVHHQEVAGWTDNTTPLFIVLGYDPVMRFDGLEGALVEDTTTAGRPSWTITQAVDRSQLSQSDGLDTTTWVIDQKTGLVVGYWHITTSEDGTVVDSEESTLTDLEVDVAISPDFPGTFPDGADVERSGDPAAFATLSIADARAQFGPGLVAPADLTDARITLSTNLQLGFSPGDPAAPGVAVTIESRTGFLRNSVEVTKFLPPEGPTPAGYAVVDGALCFSADGTTCEANQPLEDFTATSASAALEGRAYGFSIGPTMIVIMGATEADTRTILASLATVP